MAENYYPIEINDTSAFSITNNGTAPSPCAVTIIPKVDVVRLVISGLSEKPLVITNIKAQDVVLLDGENRTITINDSLAFDQFEGWEFPKLQPGINHIEMTNAPMLSIQIAYNARYI